VLVGCAALAGVLALLVGLDTLLGYLFYLLDPDAQADLDDAQAAVDDPLAAPGPRHSRPEPSGHLPPHHLPAPAFEPEDQEVEWSLF
jgi:hypothetical protein